MLLGALGMLGPLGLKSLVCKMGHMSPSSVGYWEDKCGLFIDAPLPGTQECGTIVLVVQMDTNRCKSTLVLFTPSFKEAQLLSLLTQDIFT